MVTGVNDMTGKLYIVGIGPGGYEHITPSAVKAIEASDTVVGYTTYINLIRDLLTGKEVYSTGMTGEIDRCRRALGMASRGRTVSLVCSGDPGIYAMAGLLFELLKNSSVPAKEDGEILTPIPDSQPSFPDIEVVPGIPALSACASRLGAPIMHDFASISLSDRLTPWEKIEQRLHAAAGADFVIVLYNPKSRGRKEHLARAVKIISLYRDAETPVGIVKAATRAGEERITTVLGRIPYERVDMQSTVIVGNSSTFIWNEYMITPRGYHEKYSVV
ncbi:MAG TPA: precorrin-3B C(17)-methyltransferase [Nitrospirae bacterium]|nr:precorrin-3B C(17)-methyltransferase [Nitrospirota bacterium]HDY72269.1 precorrin-3B C(17)-methyltransferase [Nitrospirota bacterium]